MSRYVVARYTPKFMGTFDPTQQYDNLCVVDNGSGTSYISKILVPPGTSLLDTTYWAFYGSTSGAILDLQDQIDSIKEIAVTPEMFGAVGDGVNDDTAYIQSAVNNGALVYLKNSYNVTSQITVPQGVKIFGTGNIIVHDYMFVFKVSGNNTIEGIHFTDDTALENEWAHIYGFEVDDVTVKDCVFDTIGLGYAIQFDHSTNLHVLNNTIKNYSFGGIMFMHTCTHCDVLNNYLYNSRWRGADHNYPICISGYQDHDYGPAEDIRCNYNYIEELSPWWEGIDSHGCNNYEIIGNVIKNCYRGFVGGYERTGGTPFTRSNCNSLIENNYIQTALPGDPTLNIGNGILIAGNAPTITENVIIRNNKVIAIGSSNSFSAGNSAIAFGLGAGDAANILVENNFISATNMVSIGYGARGNKNDIIRIIGNFIDKIVAGSGACYGIYMAYMYSHTGVVIEGNVCNPSIVNDPSAARFMRGPVDPPANNQLVEYRNNNEHGLQVDSGDYMTNPKASLPVVTQATGVLGQFIPSTAVGVVGYFCKTAGTWLTISGT